MGLATRGSRRLAGVAGLLAALVVAAGCSSSGGAPSGRTSGAATAGASRGASSAPSSAKPTGTPGRPGQLAAALRFVPAGTNEVYFTDWTAAGHPHSLSSLSARFFSSRLTSSPFTAHAQLGVFTTDAEWEMDAAPSWTTVLRFARPAVLAAIGRRLAALGWTRSGTSNSQVYTCRPDARCRKVQRESGWAADSDFAIDRSAGIFVDYPRGTAPVLPSATLSGAAVVRDLVAAAPAPVAATLRIGARACDDFYSWFQDPSAPGQVRDQLERVQRGLSRVTGTLLAIETSTGLTGTAAVVLGSPDAARREAVRRAGLADELARLADVEPSGLAIRPAGTAGSLARYSIRAERGRDIALAAGGDDFGVNLCPRSVTG